jgi:hypothetical protein
MHGFTSWSPHGHPTDSAEAASKANRKVRLAFDLEKFSKKVSHVSISLFPALLPGGLEIAFMIA